MLSYCVKRLCNFHPAAFAAAAGVDLRLDHPDLTAELLRCFHRLIDREGREAARRRHAVFAQHFLALVLVDLQAALPRYHFGYHFFTVSVVVSSAWHWSSWKGLRPSSRSSFISPAKVWIAAVGMPESISVRCVHPFVPPRISLTFFRKSFARLRPMSLR